MERRKIVAAIIDIANQLDEMGMYSEANQLTKVAQAAGRQVMKGLKDVGDGTMKGFLGLGRDINEGLRGVSQGFSDAGELLGNMGSEAGYATGANARELGMGSAPTSNAEINAQIETLRNYIERKDFDTASYEAKRIDVLISNKIQKINNGPGAGTTTAKEEVAELMRKQFEVRKLRTKVQPRSGAGVAYRGQANQMHDPKIVNDWIYTNSVGKNLTKGQLYDLAKQEKGDSFANSMAQQLNDKNITRREQIVNPSR